MSKYINFTKADLMEGYVSSLIVYEAKGEFAGDVVAVRITKDKDGWSIRVRKNCELKFTIVDTGSKTLKRAKYEANAQYNPEYDFINDLDGAYDHYKL